MDIENERNRLAYLRQDYSALRETLGESGVRRVISDLIDAGIVSLLALALKNTPINPWFAMGYFLVRDFPPIGHGIGKGLTGIRIYSANSLAEATPRHLVTRGLANLFVVLPLGFILMSFMAYVMVGVVSLGFIFFWWGRDSIFLRAVGYDYQTGRTIADRLAGTHLIRPRDVESLASMALKIETMKLTISINKNAEQ